MVEALFWLSFFALHWLILLDVVERDSYILGSEVFFFVGACLISVGKAAGPAGRAAAIADVLREEKKKK